MESGVSPGWNGLAEPSHHVLDVLGSQGDMRRERPMEYRWAVGEGQRGSYLEGWGGDASISPAEAWGSTGISDLGDWEVMRPPSKSSALTSLGGVAGVEQRDRVRGLALTKQLCV